MQTASVGSIAGLPDLSTARGIAQFLATNMLTAVSPSAAPASEVTYYVAQDGTIFAPQSDGKSWLRTPPGKGRREADRRIGNLPSDFDINTAPDAFAILTAPEHALANYVYHRHSWRAHAPAR